MDEFFKYFKSMLEQLMRKSGGGEMNFDIKGFDVNSTSPLMQMFLAELQPKKKEKLAIRKLAEEELQQYRTFWIKKIKYNPDLRRLIVTEKIRC